MFFFISKILHFLISPFTWVFVLLVLGILLKTPKKKKRLLIALVVLLYFFSNNFIFDEFIRAYEDRDASFSEIHQQYDVAIILGGFTTYDEELKMEQFHQSIDRLLHGMELYKTGKAKKMMLVGGSGSIAKPNEKEALILFNFLVKLGIPQKDIIVESASKNTHENAINTTKILNETYKNGSFILVTSGYHMPRAKRCFKKTGLIITPFSVDQYAGPRKYELDHLLIPDAQVLFKWNMLVHEWTGFIIYKLMGYI